MENAPAVPLVVILESDGRSFPISCFDNNDFLSQATTIAKTENKPFSVQRFIRRQNLWQTVDLQIDEIDDGWRVRLLVEELSEEAQEALLNALSFNNNHSTSDISATMAPDALFAGETSFDVEPVVASSPQRTGDQAASTVPPECRLRVGDVPGTSSQHVSSSVTVPQGKPSSVVAINAHASRVEQRVISFKRTGWPNQFDINFQYFPPLLVEALNNGSKIKLSEGEIRKIVGGVKDHIYSNYVHKLRLLSLIRWSVSCFPIGHSYPIYPIQITVRPFVNFGILELETVSRRDVPMMRRSVKKVCR